MAPPASHFVNAFTVTWCSHVAAQPSALSEVKADHMDQISLTDMTLRCDSSSVHCHVTHCLYTAMWLIVCTPPCDSSSVHRHIDTYLMMPCAVGGDEQHNGPVQHMDHAEWLRLKPGSWIVGSQMRFLLGTETDCHSSLHWDELSAGDSNTWADHITAVDDLYHWHCCKAQETSALLRQIIRAV